MISWELHFRDVWNQNISISISVHTTETHSPANVVLFKAWRFQIFLVPKNQWVDFFVALFSKYHHGKDIKSIGLEGMSSIVSSHAAFL